MGTLVIYACHPSYLFRATTMSALGQKRTFREVETMSASPPSQSARDKTLICNC